MLHTIKLPILFFFVAFLILTPIAADAWGGDGHGRNDGRAYHEHDFHANRNPDLTLVSGMDDIDSKVLVDPAPDLEPEEINEPAPVIAPTIPSSVINADADGNYIVNVPNNAGGYTPIRIQKSGNGYEGPQGEFYYPFPEVSQLKAMYGL